MHMKTVFLAMSDKLAVLWKAGKTLFINNVSSMNYNYL